MEKCILGLDPGLATLGFGAIRVNDLTSHSTHSKANEGSEEVTVLDFGVVKTSAKMEMGQRLIVLYDDMLTLLDQYQPDLVAIEKLFFYRMGNTIAVAQARGVILLALAQRQAPFVEFTPAQIKQALTGYGNADKHEMQQAVTRELNLSHIPQPDDAADGLAVALTAWFRR